MNATAAVLYDVKKPVVVEPVELMEPGAHEVRVTASIGLTVLDTADGEPANRPDADEAAEHLLAQADEAMYRAKAAGKDGVCAFPAASASPQAPLPTGR